MIVADKTRHISYAAGEGQQEEKNKDKLMKGKKTGQSSHQTVFFETKKNISLSLIVALLHLSLFVLLLL